MPQSVKETYHFYLGRSSYKRINMRGWLMLGGCLLLAMIALVVSKQLWTTYSHDFTFYLKWQDALEFLLWFVAFLMLGGSVFVLRFLVALRSGYRKGMIILVGQDSLIVRDLVAENLTSIFWIMHSAFWCFVGVLVGMLPEMLIGWTPHLPNIVLAVFATAIAIVLSLAGLVVSGISGTFIVIGCIGAISFCRKLGAAQRYQLSNHIALRIDGSVLTIIYPGTPESMIDLRLLDEHDRRRLLALLHEYWTDAQQIWNPALGKEIEKALLGAEEKIVLA
ncbi:MAG TPA: hypothetical protein VKY19_24785 [Ktedonosporobacter sp.]|jgi:hypothetical protein|nr:hypothetical protein [Ktedonosporobacter sp.]